MRRYEEPVDYSKKYTHRPGAYVILERAGQLLLTLQTLPNPELQIPGGGIDPGENPIQTLHREVMEETGWHFQLVKKVGAYQRYTYMDEYDMWAQKICHIYLGRPILRLSEPLEPQHSVVWMPVRSAMTELNNHGDRDFVKSVFG